MVKGIVLRVVFYGVHGRWAIKGPRHARSPVSLPDVSMTAGARFGAHIAGILARWPALFCPLSFALSMHTRRREKVAAREVSHRRQRSQQDPCKLPLSPHC